MTRLDSGNIRHGKSPNMNWGQLPIDKHKALQDMKNLLNHTGTHAKQIQQCSITLYIFIVIAIMRTVDLHHTSQKSPSCHQSKSPSNQELAQKVPNSWPNQDSSCTQDRKPQRKMTTGDNSPPCPTMLQCMGCSTVNTCFKPCLPFPSASSFSVAVAISGMLLKRPQKA